MNHQELHGESLALTERLVADRRWIHRHPELSDQETQTAGYIAERLSGLGLEPRLLLNGTGVVADLEGRAQGPVLMLRADIDALPLEERGEDREYRSQVPGVMHACGHDGHAAIALAAGELLLRHRRDWPGTVRLTFQPAEETANGAQRMIDAGVMEEPRVDAAIGLHLWCPLQVGEVGVHDGAIFASADEFRVELRGRGGHGAIPHQALDPIPIASLIVLALQILISRETAPTQPAVLTVGMVNGGQAFNIIPETVWLSGTVRAFTDEDRQRILRRIDEVAQGIARAFGATAEVTLRAGCPPVVSSPAIDDLVRGAVGETSGATLLDPEPLTVADDVGLFLRQVPGCYFVLGAGNRSRGISAPHHHPEFDIDERCLPLGAEIMARSALAYLCPRAQD